MEKVPARVRGSQKEGLSGLGPPLPNPPLEFLPRTMLEGEFQDTEMEMRPQKGRERPR